MSGPDGPRGADGKPLQGAALKAHQTREDIAALARVLVRFLVRETRLPAAAAMASLGGPDGDEDAFRVLKLAGAVMDGDLGPALDAQRAQAPAQVSTGSGWQGDPEHHPDVTRLIMAGAPMAEVNAKLRELAAERESGKAAAADSGVLWTTRDGQTVTDATRAPVQLSHVHADVRPLGYEDGPAPDFQKHRPPSAQPRF